MMVVSSKSNLGGESIGITVEELARVRQLGDFDLTMLLSEIHDFGWVHPKYPNVGGKALLLDIWKAHEMRQSPKGH